MLREVCATNITVASTFNKYNMTNDSAAWGRIMQVIRDNNVRSVHQFARVLGLKRSENLYQIKKGNHGISKNLATTINRIFPAYSVGWLVSGEVYHEKLGVQLSFYNSYSALLHEEEPDKKLLIDASLVNGAEVATIYTGNALQEKIPIGSFLYLKKTEYVIPGSVYLIETDSFTTLRVIRNNGDSYRLTTFSSVDDEDFIVEKTQIKSLFNLCAYTVRLRD